MKDLKGMLSSKLITVAIIIFLAVTVAVAFGSRQSKNEVKQPTVREITGNAAVSSSPNQPPVIGEAVQEQRASFSGDQVSKAVLSVSGMSCSGCIATIKGSLADMQGIQDILVNISSGKAEIYFDNKVITDVGPMASAITASGYPAQVLKVYSPEEIKKERDLAAAKSAYYVATVGGWDIARADFDNEMKFAKKRYVGVYGDALFDTAQGKALLDNLKAQVASRLINEGILMQEITKAKFTVDPQRVDKALESVVQEHGKNLEDFRKSLEEIGYDFAYFKKKLEIKVLITSYLDERILVNASNQFERQNQFNTWFTNARVLAEVVYYDKDLEGLIQAQAAAGGCSGG